jgi:D-glycero-alpha-D-manno-heptose-7-phosphate kinase
VPDDRVPTGVQDYRPALYGGVAAIELRVDGIARVGLDVDPRELERASCSPTPARRATPAPTTGRSPSGTSTATATSSTASSASATRRRDARRARARRLGRGRPQIAVEWDNRKRLAPGVTTPTIDDLIARAAAAGDRGEGLRRRRRRLSVLLRSAAARRPIAQALAAGGARVLDYRIETEGCGLDNVAIARIPAGDRRSPRNQGREPVQDPRLPERRRHRVESSARDSRASTSADYARSPASARPRGAHPRDRANR